MTTRYYEDEELEQEQDREISLGAPTILGIFFLLALVCAVFFGFGYSIGRKSAASAAIPAADSTAQAASIKTTGAAKPTPGEPAANPDADPAIAMQHPQPVEEPYVTETPDAEPSTPAKSAAKPSPTAAPATTTAHAATPATHPTPTTAATAPAPTPAAAAAPAAAATIHSLVQVAAVSHQEDADTLLTALHRHGYDVAVRHEPQDKLLHIQIGPLPTRKDADAMRQRLLADGYNAIIK